MTTKYAFPGYTMEHDGLDKTDGWARTAILIKDNIKYKRRRDLENKGISTVWIQIGFHRQKQFLLQALYRQYQRHGLKSTKSHPEQTKRWTTITNSWDKANKEGREVITLGDTNIDSMIWDKPINTMSNFDKHRQKLYDILKETILDGGTAKINNEYTRHDNPPNGRFSCLDHAYTTHPLKISNHKTDHTTFSDHASVEINKAVREIKQSKKFIRIRSMKNFNKNDYTERIVNHHKYILTLHENDPDEIAKNITQIIQDSATQTAPIKRIQLSQQNKVTLSDKARRRLSPERYCPNNPKRKPNFRKHKRIKKSQKHGE